MTTLAERLKSTRNGIFGTLFKKNIPIDDNIINELEDRLLLADTGVKTTDLIINALINEIKNTSESSSPEEKLKKILLPLLIPEVPAVKITGDVNKPHLMLIVGVNGVGKTTTIGKLTKYLKSKNKNILLAAADTFRAAAADQLQVWGERNNVNVISRDSGSDPGAVIYDALQIAQAQDIDVLIADTAGRLHNKKNLMEEIKKINKISSKFDKKIKQETILILDATTGQNAIAQANEFNQAIGINGIILTKLDGTAKGGIVFNLMCESKIPIHFLGIGEDIDDLCPFNAEDFIGAILNNNS